MGSMKKKSVPPAVAGGPKRRRYIGDSLRVKEFWAFAGINGVCGIKTLSPDDLIRPCVLVKGHAGFCDGGVK